jgi:DNA modification methylase
VEKGVNAKMKFEDMLNTITLGDSYKLIKDIPDKSIDLIYTDIPYLFYVGNSKRYRKNKE